MTFEESFMPSKSNKLWIDCMAGSQLRDSQGEMLSVEGADISELIAGRGRLNDNHGKGFFNSVGRITEAKKIFKAEDCENDRHRYYWEKVKAPYIYCKGYLYNEDDHQNAKAAVAILRNLHKEDSPLKLKASVEGGVIQRGLKDERLLALTKIHSVALTFTPANHATLVEPLDLSKSAPQPGDMHLIESVKHLAQENVPSFRHIVRTGSASKVHENLKKINDMVTTLKGHGLNVNIPLPNDILESSIEHKISNNVVKIRNLVSKLNKALTAGYGGAGRPTDNVQGGVFQSESVEGDRFKIKGFTYTTCPECGNEQIYVKRQLRCRDCGKSWSFEKIFKLIQSNK